MYDQLYAPLGQLTAHKADVLIKAPQGRTKHQLESSEGSMLHAACQRVDFGKRWKPLQLDLQHLAKHGPSSMPSEDDTSSPLLIVSVNGVQTTVELLPPGNTRRSSMSTSPVLTLLLPTLIMHIMLVCVLRVAHLSRSAEVAAGPDYPAFCSASLAAAIRSMRARRHADVRLKHLARRAGFPVCCARDARSSSSMLPSRIDRAMEASQEPFGAHAFYISEE